MSVPATEPIGLQLTRTARLVSRAFDHALDAVGGSLSVWLVLVSLKGQRHRAQRELAESVGIDSATLTHHLNRMEKAGLVTREREPENRRAHRVELTKSGEAMFQRCLLTVIAFDARLRGDLTVAEIEALSVSLSRLRDHVANPSVAETVVLATTSIPTNPKGP